MGDQHAQMLPRSLTSASIGIHWETSAPSGRVASAATLSEGKHDSHRVSEAVNLLKFRLAQALSLSAKRDGLPSILVCTYIYVSRYIATPICHGQHPWAAWSEKYRPGHFSSQCHTRGFETGRTQLRCRRYCLARFNRVQYRTPAAARAPINVPDRFETSLFGCCSLSSSLLFRPSPVPLRLSLSFPALLRKHVHTYEHGLSWGCPPAGQPARARPSIA